MDEKKIPQEAVATPSDVRRVLELSPEEIERLRKQQAKALKLYKSRARLSPREQQVGRGIELERHYRQTGNLDGLAEALSMQGRFAEAAAVAANPVLREQYLERDAAVHSPDDDCSCPTYREENGLHIPNQHVEANVVSLKHGDVMPAIRCRVCGKLNVRPLFQHLAEQRTARAKSIANERQQIKADEFFKTKR
jgi:phage FluMu protein Com